MRSIFEKDKNEFKKFFTHKTERIPFEWEVALYVSRKAGRVDERGVYRNFYSNGCELPEGNHKKDLDFSRVEAWKIIEKWMKIEAKL